MLTTMGQGVVLNTLLQMGFTPSYSHFDICRLFKRADNGDLINAELTMEVDFGNHRGADFAGREIVQPANFPRELATIANTLSRDAGCRMVTTPGACSGNCVFASVASFERVDNIALGTPHGGPAPSHYQRFSTKVKVRLSIQKAD
ncbi:MAG: hypothetical protein JSS86_16335 [Cyanobacteria bacterium SZAS LIN-2]|nr:hypothetical protein [Cyanobacteria bacterium SZAS LIN-2]